MKIPVVVMSRSAARNFSYKTDRSTAIISISDVGEPPNHFSDNPNIKDVCRLWFDDVNTGEKNCITAADANTILDFVDRVLNKVDLLIIHCAAGISRSAGIAAALMLILNGSDAAIFDNPRYCPNSACYNAVLRAHFGSAFDETESEQKFRKNIKLWCKTQGL